MKDNADHIIVNNHYSDRHAPFIGLIAYNTAKSKNSELYYKRMKQVVDRLVRSHGTL